MLAAAEPRWTLTGGGALAGLNLGHRTTRDLDLFWRGLTTLPDLAPLLSVLGEAGVRVDVLRRTPGFVELRASSGEEVTVIDLVADPVPCIEPPALRAINGVEIQVDSQHEILVNKLNALLSRSELRDLIDLRALLEAGGDLDRGLRDAALKDGGFSAVTLAWVLKQLPVLALARASGVPNLSNALIDFRDRLVLTLARDARP